MDKILVCEVGDEDLQGNSRKVQVFRIFSDLKGQPSKQRKISGIKNQG